MKLTPELKSQIDSMSYEQLLDRWRNAPSGDQMMRDESGVYWGERMKELRQEPGGQGRHIIASKLIGW